MAVLPAFGSRLSVFAPKWANLSVAERAAATRVTGADDELYKLAANVANTLPNVADINALNALASPDHGDSRIVDSPSPAAYHYDTRTKLPDGSDNPDVDSWVSYGSATIGVAPGNPELDPIAGSTSWELVIPARPSRTFIFDRAAPADGVVPTEVLELTSTDEKPIHSAYVRYTDYVASYKPVSGVWGQEARTELTNISGGSDSWAGLQAWDKDGVFEVQGETGGAEFRNGFWWKFGGVTKKMFEVPVQLKRFYVSYADANAESIPDKTTILMAGYYESGDAGEGWFMTYHATGRAGVAIDDGHLVAGDGVDDYYSADELSFNVCRYGAVGDNVADDTAPVQAAAARGGIFVPHGKIIRLTSVITPTRTTFTISGTGRRTIRDFFTAGNGLDDFDDHGIIHVDHAGDGFYLTTLNELSGFYCHDVTIVKNNTFIGNAFTFMNENLSYFNRDYTFNRVSVAGFRHCWYADMSTDVGTTDQHGVFKAFDCNIRSNAWIHNYGNGARWNGFTFIHCDAGNNGYSTGNGGIRVYAQVADISNNVLEGQRDAVYVFGATRHARVEGNYFEANVGQACVQFETCRGSVICNNAYFVVGGVDDTVVMRSCQRIQTSQPYTSIGNTGCNPTDAFPCLGPVDDDFKYTSAMSWFGHVLPQYAKKPAGVGASYRIDGTDREISPFDNAKLTRAVTHTTSGAGIAPYSRAGLAGAAGQWLCATWAFKKDDSDVSHAVLRANNAGISESSILSYRLPESEWIIGFMAGPLTQTLTTAELNFWPQGINPAAGMTCRIIPPTFYIVDTVNDVEPWMNLDQTFYYGGNVQRGVALEAQLISVGANPALFSVFDEITVYGINDGGDTTLPQYAKFIRSIVNGAAVWREIG
ncbi:hypothetical protein [uncultured Paraglaciecola sp.]|uniref:hypothetical protein n=1 Tax=uncultured Paraglaciecola sp. TaxID=1765024 RepID=UPI00262B1473|nr:hypothetical protein [uncultured Paraglaciecola sp.]